jgi:hypothetical protein
MRAARTKRVSTIASLALVVLAIVPLLLRAHVHRDTDAVASPCAACFVAHHATVKPSTPAPILGAVDAQRAAPEAVRVVAFAEPRSTNAVRAPPALS